MAELRNPAKERMLNGGLAIGAAARIARTAEIVPAFKTAGMDWLFLDLEHGPMSIDTASQIAVTCLQSGMTAIARVPNGEFGMATRLLDNGALGLVMPHINTAAEAKALVTHLRFPPEGDRSVFGGMPQFSFESRPVRETSEILNRETLIIAMIETAEAVENAPEIAEVPGIDVLFIGTNDLCADLKIPGEFAHPSVAAAYDRTIAACRANRKWAGMGGLYQDDLMAQFIKSGVQFILAGSDFSFMLPAATRKVSSLRSNTPA
jgi:2-keto-3-deoxy-L-rhamnonate aldolase RhmA